jgi:hypothetical protein
MRRCNFSDMEIEMFFAKYDDDGDGIFNIKEESLMMSDLNTDRVDAGVNTNFL